MSDEQHLDSDMQPRRRLGRGLSSLLGRGPQTEEGAPAPSHSPALGSIPIEGIERNPWQPRKDFDADGMRELADSIREHGVLQPVLVRELPTGGFQLIAGERRWQAARQAGLSEIPCRLVDVIDQTACEFALEENLKRKDLNDIEKARAFKRYLDEFGTTIDELSKQLSMSRPAVSNILRLLELSEPVQAALYQGKITAGHARALIKLDEIEQGLLLSRIQNEGLSVRETEACSKDSPHAEDAPAELHQPADTSQAGESADVVPMDRPDKPQPSNHVLSVQEHLRGLLGVNVEIKLTADDRGQIAIPFANNDEFESILRKLRRAAA